MASPPTTMQDIARRAGVHASTVSRALRNDPRITPGQRQKILRAAQDLDYRANPLIAALMTARRTRSVTPYRATLGFLKKHAASDAAWFTQTYGQLLTGARDRALAQGYHLEEFNLADPDLTPRRITEILVPRGVPGLLVAPLHSVQDSIELDWSQFCSVAVGFSLQTVQISRVAHNHFSGLALATRQCRGLQERVAEKVEKRWVAAALLDQSEQPDADRVAPLLLDYWDEAIFAAWFRRHRPEVILGVNLTEVPRWLGRFGCRVPHDVGLVSLDRRTSDRGIAGIDQDYARVGGNAVDVMIGLLQRNERGLPNQPATVLSDGAWINGRSLRPKPNR
ncbi:MAG: LacI family DNA-binding transcriptional regulator [Verrucomicrobia bacterium]|nr:LacI family DNA-binding transcriptional regulator [Verrucomicrobiota bacterium]